MLVRSYIRVAAATMTLALAGIAPAFAQSAPASPPSAGARTPEVMGETHVYALTAQNGSGEIGTVTLRATGDKTRVTVALVNSTVPQPLHIHEGTCAKLTPAPKYPLTLAADGYSTTLVDAPIATLIGGGFAVNVHESTTNIAKYVACGNLGTAK